MQKSSRSPAAQVRSYIFSVTSAWAGITDGPSKQQNKVDIGGFQTKKAKHWSVFQTWEIV